MSKNIRNVVIIGSGPAAHTAAIYTARAGLSPLMYEGYMAGGTPAGGQLTTTTHIENFPGFPEGISGVELMDRMRNQSIKFGAEIITETVIEIVVSENIFVISTKNRKFFSKTVIVATGATAKRMEIKGASDHEFWNKGVSACAVCDGALPIFRGKPLFVVGGGDTAMEEALFLSKFGSKVFVVHRRDELRASKIMQERAKKSLKIEFLFSHIVTEAKGSEFLSSVIVKNLKTDEEKTLPAAGLFFAIGHSPNTSFLPKEIYKDENGYVLTEPGTTKTSIKGIFCAGDAQDKKWRQAITAAGTGCMAALETEKYIESLE